MTGKFVNNKVSKVFFYIAPFTDKKVTKCFTADNIIYWSILIAVYTFLLRFAMCISSFKCTFKVIIIILLKSDKIIV